MASLFRLTRVLLFGNGYAGLGSDARRKRRLSGIGNVLLFGFLAVYFIGVIGISAWGLYDVLSSVGLEAAMLGLFVSAGVLVVFVFGMMYVISIFYFANDIEHLLPLPLQPEQIIGAKFLVTLVYEYMFVGVIVLPALSVYGYRSGAGFLYYLTMVVVFLLLPVIPLVFAAVIIMLLMRFTRFGRNRDRFNMAASIIALALALGFSFGLQSLSASGTADLGQLISEGGERVAQITTTVFPGTIFATRALAEAGNPAGLASLALLLLAAGAALLLLLAAGRMLYFKGVIGLTGSTAVRRRLTKAELESTGRGSSSFLALVLKDIRVLVRTPIFFINCVLLNFLWPLFVLLPFLTGGEAFNPESLAIAANEILQTGGQILPLSLVVIFAFTVFLSSTNGIAASAVSREGRQFYIMKIIPVSYPRQAAAKISVAVLFSVIGWLLMFLMAVFLFKLPLWYLLALVMIMPGAILLPNLSGFIFDLLWPKLHWDNEQTAVKRNVNVLYGMLSSLLISLLLGILVYFLNPSYEVSLLILVAVPLLIAAVLAVFLRRQAANLFAGIQA